MKRVSTAIASLLAATLLGASTWAAGLKENLDLPFDAVDDIDDGIDGPDEHIFYLTRLEGDGFFYAIDKSSSMANGELDRAKSEVKRNIGEFSSRVQFGIVFFDAGIVKFPSSGQPAEATGAMKQAARGFVNGVAAGSGSCPMQGILQALQLANRATSRRKVIVYLGDGGGTCMGADEARYLERALAAITAQNYQRVKIDTIGILEMTPLGESFLRRLAAANGGSYTRIR